MPRYSGRAATVGIAMQVDVSQYWPDSILAAVEEIRSLWSMWIAQAAARNDTNIVLNPAMLMPRSPICGISNRTTQLEVTAKV